VELSVEVGMGSAIARLGTKAMASVGAKTNASGGANLAAGVFISRFPFPVSRFPFLSLRLPPLTGSPVDRFPR
jgi:hypothetical protein